MMEHASHENHLEAGEGRREALVGYKDGWEREWVGEHRGGMCIATDMDRSMWLRNSGRMVLWSRSYNCAASTNSISDLSKPYKAKTVSLIRCSRCAALSSATLSFKPPCFANCSFLKVTKDLVNEETRAISSLSSVVLATFMGMDSRASFLIFGNVFFWSEWTLPQTYRLR